MALARTAVSASVALLLMLLATLAVQGELLGSALANAFVPERVSEFEDADSTLARPAREDLSRTALGQLYEKGEVTFRKLKPLPPEFVDEETLWLARCIFSETKRPHEQELVAWVVRNRVETEYRGNTTYKDVVLDPMQFSAFNDASGKRSFYTSLSPESRLAGWQTALRIAHEVRWGDGNRWRPFSARTRHFYSEQSMTDQQHPDWAYGFNPVSPARDYTIEPHRFRFYEGIN